MGGKSLKCRISKFLIFLTVLQIKGIYSTKITEGPQSTAAKINTLNAKLNCSVKSTQEGIEWKYFPIWSSTAGQVIFSNSSNFTIFTKSPEDSVLVIKKLSTEFAATYECSPVSNPKQDARADVVALGPVSCPPSGSIFTEGEVTLNCSIPYYKHNTDPKTLLTANLSLLNPDGKVLKSVLDSSPETAVIALSATVQINVSNNGQTFSCDVNFKQPPPYYEDSCFFQVFVNQIPTTSSTAAISKEASTSVISKEASTTAISKEASTTTPIRTVDTSTLRNTVFSEEAITTTSTMKADSATTSTDASSDESTSTLIATPRQTTTAETTATSSSRFTKYPNTTLEATTTPATIPDIMTLCSTVSCEDSTNTLMSTTTPPTTTDESVTSSCTASDGDGESPTPSAAPPTTTTASSLASSEEPVTISTPISTGPTTTENSMTSSSEQFIFGFIFGLILLVLYCTKCTLLY